tara:strand:- start:412 stop:576 length:165 start_codon:yes stop_codon:yes gene_type:complete
MVRKFLIKAFGLKDYMKKEQEKEIFPKPHYIGCCSGEEHRQVEESKRELDNRGN